MINTGGNVVPPNANKRSSSPESRPVTDWPYMQQTDGEKPFLFLKKVQLQCAKLASVSSMEQSLQFQRAQMELEVLWHLIQFKLGSYGGLVPHFF